MNKYQILKTQYEQLEQQLIQCKAKLMEMTYQYNTLREEYTENVDQQKEIKELHESTRRLKHDMKNHLMVITAYLNDNEIPLAIDYISGIINKLNHMYTYIETGNSIVNYCVNLKLHKAQEHNILFKVEVENLSFQRVEGVDLSAILTNLLDNAIEASYHVSQPLIEICISKKRSYETIVIKNRIEESILHNNSSLTSTKQDEKEHGIGLKQVKRLVEKYDGMIDIYEENDMFCVMVAVYP